jgi:class 3 adenylate cyclase
MSHLSPATTDQLPHRVLLLDDQAMIGEAVRRRLAGAPDIVFEFCRTWQTALAVAEAFRPTVILQDLIMPGIEGLEMVGLYRAHPATADVPVIVLSAREEPTVKAQLLDAGANDYVVKLPDQVELIARIRVHSEAYRRLLERNEAFTALERSHAELDQERKRSERLLLGILPAAIAEQLKDGQALIAESFSDVTVMFADLCGFTEYSEQVDPRHLVGLLDEIFSMFDHLADALGVEKIKTIGDAYMAVAGLPVPRSDHAQAMAAMALGMQEAFRDVVRSRGLALDLRIGLHSGPVVAGVIGRQKFAYDLWGDTVNVASRMESHGEPSRIHVSSATRSLLGDEFRFVDRGDVPIKGRGPLHTFFLLGRV